MIKHVRWMGAGAVAVAAIVSSVALLAQPRPRTDGLKFPLPAEPRVYDTFRQKIKVSVVARGIERPWSLLPLPDGDFLVSVRPTGQILAIRKGVLDPKPLTGLPAMHVTRNTGMLDIAMHPKFAENKWIYFTYHKPLEGETYTLALARGRYDGAGLSDVKDLYVGNAVRTGGSRLTFASDGLIYLTVGGAGRSPDAQALTTIYGKVLRLKDDGTVPADNPFTGKAGARPEIFTFGHRDHFATSSPPLADTSPSDSSSALRR